jgi:hypothetical protein
MPDYAKTIIYKIQHEDNEDLVYVGSTTDFTKRKYRHKYISNNPNDKCYNLKLYKMINDNGGWEAFKMIQIKEFSCNNKREAEAQEDAVIVELKASMNDKRASRSQKEYYEENKDKIIENQKQYYELNKEKLSQKQKQYYELNKEKILENKKEYHKDNIEKIIDYQKEYRKMNKEKISQNKKEYYELNKEQLSQKNKEYYELNKEQLTQYKKQYYELNKEHISQQMKQKVTCECGCVFTKTNLERHKKSTKHAKLLNETKEQ